MRIGIGIETTTNVARAFRSGPRADLVGINLGTLIILAVCIDFRGFSLARWSVLWP